MLQSEARAVATELEAAELSLLQAEAEAEAEASKAALAARAAAASERSAAVAAHLYPLLVTHLRLDCPLLLIQAPLLSIRWCLLRMHGPAQIP